MPVEAYAFEMKFPPAEQFVRQMRRSTAEHLQRWGLSSMINDATLAVSELVTNAICYGDGHPIGFRVVYSTDELRIEVTDSNSAPARLLSATENDERGRGLHLVAEVADNWEVSADGKTTWCVFSTRAGRS